MITAPQNTEIGMLSARGARRDEPALRLALSSQISALDLRSAAMPPAAILIVRKLSDPLPGSILADGRYSGLNKAWESALNARLDDAYHAALAPQNGLLPGDAENVVFSDWAQMLACLLSDLAARRAGERWWWRQLLHAGLSGEDVSVQVTWLCLHHLRSLPAALEHLQEWRKAETVLMQIDASDARRIAGELCRSQGFAGWLEAIESRSGDAPENELETRSGNAGSSDGITGTDHASCRQQSSFSGHRAAGSRPRASPWAVMFDGRPFDARLSVEQELLMGLGRALYRRPWILRQQAFRKSVSAWLRQAERIDRESNRLPGERAWTIGEQAEPVVPNAMVPRLDKPGDDQPGALSAAPGVATIPGCDARDCVGVVPAAVPAATHTADACGDQTPAVHSRLFLDGACLGTALGGVFYLINLIEHLRITECFEQDWGLASQISRWGLLEVIARSMLGPAMSAYAEDAIWPLLAELDERDAGDLVGSEVKASASYRLPEQWFTDLWLEDGEYRWAAARGMLRLWCEDVVLLAEVERDAMPARQQALELLRQYSDQAVLRRRAWDKAPLAPINFACHANLARLLARLSPALRQFLRLAMNDQSLAPEEAGKRLLECPGQIHVTRSHIDFVSLLDQISLEARACGLDRDPGWLPEYSRCVKFHFN